MVKRITVVPDGILSLQKNFKRAEHWVVVQGVALVTCEEKKFILGENEYTYIPVQAIHRLENTGEINLELIIIQTGKYLDENDIVRYEDHYGRLVSYVSS